MAVMARRRLACSLVKTGGTPVCPDRLGSLSSHFFINSSTAVVIPIMPVRMVGSGTGANLLECRLGNSFPSFLYSAIFAGSTAPMWKSTAGIEWSARLYSEKSSPPIVGSTIWTFSSPSALFQTVTSRLVNFGLLYVAGRPSFKTVTAGIRSAGTPPALATPFAI